MSRGAGARLCPAQARAARGPPMCRACRASHAQSEAATSQVTMQAEPAAPCHFPQPHSMFSLHGVPCPSPCPSHQKHTDLVSCLPPPTLALQPAPPDGLRPTEVELVQSAAMCVQRLPTHVSMRLPACQSPSLQPERRHVRGAQEGGGLQGGAHAGLCFCSLPAWGHKHLANSQHGQVGFWKSDSWRPSWGTAIVGVPGRQGSRALHV